MRLLLLAATATFLLGAETYPDKPVVPRKSPEYVINMPNGKQRLLLQDKGKVICVEFLFTTCPHCQASAKILTKLQNELGPQGLQVLGVAINPVANMLVNDFMKTYQVGYPVGFDTPENALKYLQVDPNKRWVVPEVVLIDRKGMIRYQTPYEGDDKLQDENYVRKMIADLLKEPSVGAKAPAAAKPATAPAKKAPEAKKTAESPKQ